MSICIECTRKGVEEYSSKKYMCLCRFVERRDFQTSNTAKQMVKLIIEEAKRRGYSESYIEHQKKIFNVDDNIDRSSM
jgi:hypothetical protein